MNGFMRISDKKRKEKNNYCWFEAVNPIFHEFQEFVSKKMVS